MAQPGTDYTGFEGSVYEQLLMIDNQELQELLKNFTRITIEGKDFYYFTGTGELLDLLSDINPDYPEIYDVIYFSYQFSTWSVSGF